MSACELPMGHKGRCKGDLGETWDGPHTTCEECDRLGKSVTHLQAQLYARDAELARLRAAVAELLAVAPVEVGQLQLFAATAADPGPTGAQ